MGQAETGGRHGIWGILMQVRTEGKTEGGKKNVRWGEGMVGRWRKGKGGKLEMGQVEGGGREMWETSGRKGREMQGDRDGRQGEGGR